MLLATTMMCQFAKIDYKVICLTLWQNANSASASQALKRGGNLRLSDFSLNIARLAHISIAGLSQKNTNN